MMETIKDLLGDTSGWDNSKIDFIFPRSLEDSPSMAVVLQNEDGSIVKRVQLLITKMPTPAVERPYREPKPDPEIERRRELMDKARQRTLEYLADARKYFRLEIPDIDIRFDLTGTVAGRATAHWVQFNLRFLSENEKTFLSEVVPHEVAHTVVAWKFRDQIRNEKGKRVIKSHGAAWKDVMRFFRAPTVATHTYEC